VNEVEGSGAATSASEPLLRLEGISKSFFGVEVLHDVSLVGQAGEVHAILGENGAGKSTLMKVIAGAHQPTAGRILLDGEEVSFAHPREAQAVGISIIYQEFNLLTDRTVAQNIFLGREPTRGPFIDRRKLEEDTAVLLDQLNVRGSISPRAKIHELSVAQQQIVEIAKALSFDARILVMDEPTASLAPPEVEALFEIVDRLRGRGMLIFYVSHRLKEIFALAQQVTILKDGQHVGTTGIETLTPRSIVKMMVGRELSDYFPERADPAAIGDVRLRISGGSNAALEDIDLELRAGEIVGIAGLEGSGRTEIAEAIFGVEPFDQGTMELDGKPVSIKRPRQAIARRIGFVTEDRKAQGLILPRSVLDNSMLPLYGLGRSDRRDREAALDEGEGSLATRLAQRVDLRAASLDQEVRFLSGGNQQKVVFAKWLATDASVLLFDEPTRGIDVGAKAGIHDLMRGLAERGAAVLMISSELPEVIGMSDRIVVMSHGRIAGELAAGPSESDIMLLATGQEDVAGDAFEFEDPGAAAATAEPDGATTGDVTPHDPDEVAR
jgi:ABC-type sugar transport system ATPase subunit